LFYATPKWSIPLRIHNTTNEGESAEWGSLLFKDITQGLKAFGM